MWGGPESWDTGSRGDTGSRIPRVRFWEPPCGEEDTASRWCWGELVGPGDPPVTPQ